MAVPRSSLKSQIRVPSIVLILVIIPRNVGVAGGIEGFGPLGHDPHLDDIASILRAGCSGYGYVVRARRSVGTGLDSQVYR